MTEPNPMSVIPDTVAVKAERPPGVLHEISEMWCFARESGLARELKSLHQPRVFRSLLAVAGDWALIAMATAATLALGCAAVPLSLLLIGNRQRALGNLLHDASHRSFDANRRRSAILADLLLCWPLWVSMRVYRDDHNRHHRFLGDPARDPDYIHDETRLSRGWLSVWFEQIRSPRMIRSSIFSHLFRMDAASLLGVVCWWVAAMGLIALASNVTNALVFLTLWVAARATVFHVITAFREISDHVGLHPGSLIGFSRNHPISSLASQIFHPHCNGYHLLHHLAPGIPFHALPRAHMVLLDWPPYAAGEHCDSHIIGEGSAVHSWVRRWTPDGAAGGV